MPTSSNAEENPKEKNEKEEEEKEEKGVLSYTCRARFTFRRGTTQEDEVINEGGEYVKLSTLARSEGVPGQVPVGFADLGVVAQDPALQRTYALATDAEQRLLAAGGHQGRVAVFDLARWTAWCVDRADPLLSYRAHGGWVSGVHFVPRSSTDSSTSTSTSPVLVTTGNDGALVVWALQPDKAPRAVGSAGLRTGVFSSDCVPGAGLAAVACKDGSVRALALDAAGAVQPHTVLAGAHAGVARCVRARPPALGPLLLASGGTDARVCVHDLRVPPPSSSSSLDPAAPVVVFGGAHTLAVNGVDWHPTNACVLASTSADRTVCMLDVRRPDVPLCRGTGHAALVARARHIHRAVFCCHGTALACGGDGSTRLTLYDARLPCDTGAVSSGTVAAATISRGGVGAELSALLSPTPATGILVAAQGRIISFFAPQYSHQGQ